MPYSATIQILGHMGRDCETKFSTAGKPLHKFQVFTADGGRDDKKFSWWDVVVFGEMPQFKLDALKKGATVYVTGRVQIEEWDKDGVKYKKVQITADSYNGVNVVAPPKDSDNGEREGYSPRSQTQPANAMVSQPRTAKQTAPVASMYSQGITDDDVPF